MVRSLPVLVRTGKQILSLTPQTCQIPPLPPEEGDLFTFGCVCVSKNRKRDLSSVNEHDLPISLLFIIILKKITKKFKERH
jgi:hypothetical protein